MGRGKKAGGKTVHRRGFGRARGELRLRPRPRAYGWPWRLQFQYDRDSVRHGPSYVIRRLQRVLLVIFQKATPACPHDNDALASGSGSEFLGGDLGRRLHREMEI